MKYKELDFKQKVYIRSANSFNGLLKRYEELNCEFSLSDDTHTTKIVHINMLKDLKRTKKIKDYSVNIDEDSNKPLHVVIELNNGEKYESFNNLKFRL